MAAKGPGGWKLDGFKEQINRWIELDQPSKQQLEGVHEWIMDRVADPYAGVRRQPGELENLWFGQIPGTSNSDGAIAVCSYWIIEETHTVRCDNFGMLHPPFS